MHNAQRILRMIFNTVEVFLLIRFALALLGASVAAPVVAFWYAITAPLIAPFGGIFPNVRYGGMVFEWQTVAALAGYAILYAIIAYVLLMLLSVGTRRHHVA